MADHTLPGLPAVRNLVAGDPDLLRGLVEQTVNALLSADADALCGADYGERSPERSNRRNGYRERRWDTRAGTIDLRIPKLREGTLLPGLAARAPPPTGEGTDQRRRRPVPGRRLDSPRREGGRSSSASSRSPRARSQPPGGELDELVEAFRTRPLDGSPYPFVMLDALVVKVREQGRIVNVCVVHATAVNREGYRESLGLDIVTQEDGAAWLAFLRGLVARGLSGVQLVTSDAHPGLVDAIRSTLTGASWQRCRTHFMRNLLTRVPRSAQRAVATLVRTIFDQADPDTVHEQYQRVLDPARGALPARRDAARRSRPRPARLHRLQPERLAADLEQQPDRATQQRDPPPHRRRLHLPRPRQRHPPRRRRARRTTRRMDRHRATLPLPRHARAHPPPDRTRTPRRSSTWPHNPQTARTTPKSPSYTT